MITKRTMIWSQVDKNVHVQLGHVFFQKKEHQLVLVLRDDEVQLVDQLAN